MNQYEAQLADYAKQVNDGLRERLTVSAPCAQISVIDAMRYSLLDAGKRLRAALVLEFARMNKASRASAVPLACAIEMVHAYSLIHDDLPCMDNDDFRRGKPSCHRQFGEANALLAGDGLLTLAFETALEAPLTDAQRVQAAAALSKAAGVFGMIGGQVIDLESEGEKLDLEQLNRLYTLKTGALLRVSARLGCIAGGADEAFSASADAFARAYGLAFQITDDILDVAGDQSKLGKPIGSDADNGKSTYAALLGLEGARAAAEEQVRQAKESAQALPDSGFLFWLADSVLTRDH